MDLHQLKTFVVVAREGSVTRASELLHLSQPAVSAHVKAIEDALEMTLFERTPRGMTLTAEGKRLLVKAEQTLGAHRDLLAEATRLKGHLAGRLRLGAGTNASHAALGRLLTALAEKAPGVEVSVQHGTSQELLAGLRGDTLDAVFYNEAGDAAPELAVTEVARFTTFLAAPPGSPLAAEPLDWRALGEAPWIFPAASACCGRTAEQLFRAHHIRPRRIVSVDREQVTRTLIASGLGVGLLHADTARAAQARGEVALLFEADAVTRVLFASLAARAREPVLELASAIMRDG